MGTALRDFLGQTGDEGPLQQYAKSRQLRTILSSATGRARFLSMNDPETASKQLFDLLSRDDLEEKERKRIQKMMSRIADPDRKGVGGTIEDAARGINTGVINTPAAVADLALAVPDLANRVVGNKNNMFRDVRGTLQESMEGVREAMDGRGTAGLVGEVAGGMAAGAAPYGGAALATGKLLSRIAPATRIAKAVQAANTPAASLGQRVAANVVTGLPINALQAASLDDATGEEKAKSLAIGVGADVLFGAAGHLMFGKKKIGDTPETTLEVTGRPSDTRADEIIAATKKAKEVEADKLAQRTDMRNADVYARAKWQEKNPTGNWKDVPKTERKELVNDAIVSRPKEIWQSQKFQQIWQAYNDAKNPQPVVPTVEGVAPVKPLPTDMGEVIDGMPESQLFGDAQKHVAPAPVPEPVVPIPVAKVDISVVNKQGEVETVKLDPNVPGSTVLPPDVTPVTPPAVANTDSYKSELQTLALPRPIAELMTMEPKELRKVFKQMKIRYESGDTVLDTLKGAVWEIHEGDPTNTASLADIDVLNKYTKKTKITPDLPPTKADPASVEGIVQQSATNPPQVRTVPDVVTTTPELKPAVVRTWLKEPLKQRSSQELMQLEQWLDDKVTSLPMVENAPYVAHRNRVMEEIASRGPVEPQRTVGPVRVMDAEMYQEASMTYLNSQLTRAFVHAMNDLEANGLIEPDFNTDNIVKFVASDWNKAFNQVMAEVHDDLAVAIIEAGPAFSWSSKATHNVRFGGSLVGVAEGVSIPPRWIKDTVGVDVPDWVLYYNPISVFASTKDVNNPYASNRAFGVVAHEWAHAVTNAADGTITFQNALTDIIGLIGPIMQKHGERLRTLYLQSSPVRKAAISDYRASRAYALLQISNRINEQKSTSTPNASRSVTGSDAVSVQPQRSSGNSASDPANGSTGGGVVSPSSGGDGSAGTNSSSPRILAQNARATGSYIRPGLGGGAGGFTFGVFATDDDDPDRWAKIAMWTAVGAGGMVASKVWNMKKVRPNEDHIIPNTARLGERIVSVDEIEGTNKSTATKLREFYIGVVRSTFGIEKYTDRFLTKDLPAQINASKLAQTWGRFVAMTESWLTDQPSFVTNKGEVLSMLDDNGKPLLPANTILVKTAQGHKQSLDKVMLARTSLELAGKGRNGPYTIDEAQQILLNAPEYLHEAADQLRQYHKGLLRLLVSTGNITQEAFDVMASEAWYAPVQRLVGNNSQLKKTGQNKSARTPDAIYGRTESSRADLYLSPFDATVEMTARILRSVEYNNIVNTMWQNSRMLPAGVGDLMMRKTDAKSSTVAQKILVKAEQLRRDLKISEQDAKSVIALVDDELLSIHPAAEVRHTIAAWDKGELVTYQVDPDVFEQFKSMKPQEINLLLRLGSAPARMASMGVVTNPAFVGSQFFIDTFNATLTSKYGFRPVYDSFRAWLAIMRGDKRIKDLMRAGGPGTIQSLRYAGDLENAVKAVHTAGKTPIETAIHQARELQPIEALKTLMMPIAESARVGEYLRALDHGESVLEATTAAWNVGGNVKIQGSAMRGVNMLTMFLRPAISALDATIYATGIPHPRRGLTVEPKQMAKFFLAGTSMTIPSALLWWAYKDDQEIQQYRRTESGIRYWWFRDWEGRIAKIRKPHVIGHLFGTLVEQTLDEVYAKDPEGTGSWLSGLADDAAVNLIPTIGVIPAALWGNKIPGLGGQIVSQGDAALEPTERGYDRASYPARVVADKIASKTEGMDVPQKLEQMLSPAAFDVIVRGIGGMWGEDALKAVTAAHEWTLEDNPPPMAELPIVGRFFAKENTTMLADIRRFYQNADKVDRVAKTVARYSVSNPQKLANYIGNNIPALLAGEDIKRTRGEIMKLWRALNDVRAMPDNMISPDTKRKLETTYIKQISMLAQVSNIATRPVFGME